MALDISGLKTADPHVVARLTSVVLQIIAGKQHPPRSKGIHNIVHSILSGRLLRQFDMYGCQIRPIPKTKGAKVLITKLP